MLNKRPMLLEKIRLTIRWLSTLSCTSRYGPAYFVQVANFVALSIILVFQLFFDRIIHGDLFLKVTIDEVG